MAKVLTSKDQMFLAELEIRHDMLIRKYMTCSPYSIDEEVRLVSEENCRYWEAVARVTEDPADKKKAEEAFQRTLRH